MARNFNSELRRTAINIDVYIKDEWEGQFSGSYSLMIQLAAILQARPKRRSVGAQLRIMIVLDRPVDGAEARMRLRLEKARIMKAQVKAIISQDLHTSIVENSSDASLVFLSMPEPSADVRSASRGHAFEEAMPRNDDTLRLDYL